MAISRRSILTLAVGGLSASLGLVTPDTTAVQAQQRTPRVRQSASGRSITLKELLERGLRARRPEEFAFIRRVVLLVERRQLSERVVKSTFNWAQRKRPYPFQYFERALRLRAAKQGLRL